MTAIDHKEENRENLKKLLQEKPMASHGYFRRDDGVLIDIPLLQVEFNIIQHPNWVLEAVSGGEQDFIPPAHAQELQVPPKPSEEAAGNIMQFSAQMTFGAIADSTPLRAPKKNSRKKTVKKTKKAKR